MDKWTNLPMRPLTVITRWVGLEGSPVQSASISRPSSRSDLKHPNFGTYFALLFLIFLLSLISPLPLLDLLPCPASSAVSELVRNSKDAMNFWREKACARVIYRRLWCVDKSLYDGSATASGRTCDCCRGPLLPVSRFRSNKQDATRNALPSLFFVVRLSLFFFLLIFSLFSFGGWFKNKILIKWAFCVLDFKI